MTPLYEITIHQDDMTEDPTSYSGFKVVGFNDRLVSYEDPEQLLVCHYEDDEGYQCDEFAREHSWSFGDDVVLDLFGVESKAVTHAFVPNPDILFTLSYSEHGRCEWTVNRLEPPRRRGFDDTPFAGLLMWDTETDHGHDRAWWDGLTFDEGYNVAVSMMKEYTSWSNGDCYGYTITKNIEPVVCECCGQRTNDPDEDIDSCWGFIGDYVLESAVNAVEYDLGRVPVKDVDYVIHGEDTVI